MKKLLFIGLAATAMLAGCSNDEIVEMPQQKAIGFSSFVNNGTRSVADPSLTKDNLPNFAVYGFTEKGQIFGGTEVSAPGWTYSPLQYWVATNTYTFGAIAPAAQKANVSGVALESGKVGMKVAFTNTDANQVDLLHAAPAPVTCDDDFIANPQKVSMTFGHQLSKVKFSFANAVGEGYNVKVTDVRITDAKETGTLTIGAANAWSAQAGSVVLTFGDAKTDDAAVIANGAEMESYNEKLMIPTDNTATYTVTFTAELFQGEVPLGSFEHTTTIKGVELKLGYCYDFKATLTHENIVDPDKPLKPIEFTVESVEDWNNADEGQELPVE